MSRLISHIQRLEWRIHELSSMRYSPYILPTMFEYYSAIRMTTRTLKPFNVWRDVNVNKKMLNNFPIQDTGVDATDENFTHIVQSKYYKKDNIISYGKLSTFLATPLLVGNNKMKLTLVRTSHSLLDIKIREMVNRGDIEDVKICNEEFLYDVENIKNFYNL